MFLIVRNEYINKLSDLSNLESVRERLDMMKEKLAGKVEDLSFDCDSLTIKVQGINLTLRIIEREPMKCVKFEGDKTPVPLNLWIQILPVTEEEAKMKVTIRAEVNMFMKRWYRNHCRKEWRSWQICWL